MGAQLLPADLENIYRILLGALDNPIFYGSRQSSAFQLCLLKRPYEQYSIPFNFYPFSISEPVLTKLRFRIILSKIQIADW